MVRLLDKFKVMSSRTMVILDWGKDNEIDRYLRKFEFIVTLSLLGLFIYLITYKFPFPFCRKNVIYPTS